MSEKLLEVRNLCVSYKTYEGNLRVVDGLNLEVRQDEKVGLVGETGCGKTTTMRAIMGILPKPVGKVDSGEIIYKGQDLLKKTNKEMQCIRGVEIAVIFQNPTAALNPVFTIGQQLQQAIKSQVPKKTGKKISSSEARERAIKALKEAALPDPERLLSNYPVQLSGGMKQRVCIALALVSDANLLIADEPGTALDVTIQDQILRLLMSSVEKRQTATLYIEHSLGVIREWMDRVYVMYAGRTVEVAKTKDLFDNPRHPYTRGLMQAVPRLTGGGIAQGIPGRVPEYVNPPSGCRFHPRCPYQIDICVKERPPYFEIGEDHKVACYRSAEID
ncbi:MAG: ABC transporter ATP-binding protein [Bacillota bacterium]|nr:ABC transporter ATP-binding protein [Bacillota bacterium]